tara:strand:- start:201 stop:629 length:429 start_codon:yes stop_codon:yes gene_type:complete
MGLKNFKIELDEEGKKKFKEACYPCTKHNDCTRSFNKKPTTVEECNTGYTVFKIDPPPADFPAPSPQDVKEVTGTVGQDVKEVTGTVGTKKEEVKVSGGQAIGGAVFVTLLPLLSYCSSCCLFFCSIFFVVKAATKQPPPIA